MALEKILTTTIVNCCNRALNNAHTATRCYFQLLLTILINPQPNKAKAFAL